MARTYSDLFPPKPEIRSFVDIEDVDTSADERRKAAPITIVGLTEFFETLVADLETRVAALEADSGP